MTVYWWGAANNCCGPLPAIWPALVLLSAVPMLVAAVRQRTTPRNWARLSFFCIFGGMVTVLLDVYAFLVRGWMSDCGWVYGPDLGTMAVIALGYASLFLDVLVLRRVTRPDRVTARSTATGRM